MDKSTLEKAKLDCARGQKRGLHFIIASVIIWALVFIVHMTDLPIDTFPPSVVALMMVAVEIIFCLLLYIENRDLNKNQ